MKRLYILMIVLPAITWSGCRYGDKEITGDLNRAIAPLPPESPVDYDDRYLENLLPWDEYSVIGLGEATHGTMEFFELKQRLFRFLAEQHNCRVLAYEYSYRKSLIINDYIHNRYDSPDSLFRGDLWIQDNETVRQFIAWMRAFNEGKEEQAKISFIGIDNQVDALEPGEVLRQISDYLPALELDMGILPYNVPGKKEVPYQEMTEGEYGEIRQALLKLENQVMSFSLSPPGIPIVDSTRIALQLVRSLQGSHEFLYLIYTEGKNIRDRQMADNVRRILAETGGDGNVAVWAHNAHVANHSHYYPDGSPSMGWYLRNWMGEKYLSVATSFSVGQFTAVMLDSAGKDTPPMTCHIGEVPPEGSLNALFCKARFPQFSLKIRGLDPASPLYRYIDSERPMMGVGDLYLGSPELHFTDDRIISLAQAHDLLFYFRDTGPLL